MDYAGMPKIRKEMKTKEQNKRNCISSNYLHCM